MDDIRVSTTATTQSIDHRASRSRVALLWVAAGAETAQVGLFATVVFVDLGVAAGNLVVGIGMAAMALAVLSAVFGRRGRPRLLLLVVLVATIVAEALAVLIALVTTANSI